MDREHTPHHFVPHYTTQLDRARRYVKRLKDCYEGRDQTRHNESKEWEDDMYSTFMHLLQVRDWFDDTVKKSATKLIRDNDSLGLCADIANLWKHSREDEKRKYRKGVRPGRAPTYIRIVASNVPELVEPQRTRFLFLIDMPDGTVEKIESLDLAEKSLALWDSFVADQKALGNIKEGIP